MTDAGESVNRDVKDCCPQVFVVDSQAFPRQVPVRLDVPRLNLIYLLLAVALLGVFIEAGCICHLYSRHAFSADIQKVEYIKGEKDTFSSSTQEFNEINPKPAAKADTKPAAFLQSASSASRGDTVLHWRTDSFPGFMKDLSYRNDSLFIQQGGYYYIFSKIAHLENCKFFQHKVMQCSENYNHKPIELMQSSRYLCDPDKRQPSGERGNSYLGGIFHLSEGDRVFVQVNNSSLVLNEPYENFFGAFMV